MIPRVVEGLKALGIHPKSPQEREAEARERERQMRLATLRSSAMSATRRQAWAEAALAWREYLALGPGDAEAVQAQLERAEKQGQLARAYAEAQAALRKKEYDRATVLLKGIVAQDETYRDAVRLLGEAVARRQGKRQPGTRRWLLLGAAGVALIVLGWLATRLLPVGSGAMPTTAAGRTATPMIAATATRARVPATSAISAPTAGGTLTAGTAPTRPPTVSATSSRFPTPKASPTVSGTSIAATPGSGTAVSAQPVKAYSMPRPGPKNVFYDGTSLWVDFQSEVAKLQMVEEENRFRVINGQWDLPGDVLDRDLMTGEYWAWITGSISTVDLLDSQGKTKRSFTLPPKFAGRPPRDIAWDGSSLWVSFGDASLHKLQPEASAGELRLIDSFVPQVALFGQYKVSGLAWDGQVLWLLNVGTVFKLNQTAQPTCSITVQKFGSDANPYVWGGLGWDGNLLWAAHPELNMLFRVDPSACR